MELSKALFNTCYHAETSVLPSVGSKPDDSAASKEPLYKSMVRGRTVGLWAKDHKEKKKQEIRTLNARIHAAVSVAGVAAAVASMAASNAMSAEATAGGKLTAAMASASALVASHCIEIAEDMGADHNQISATVSSAINARTNGDIMALTAGAATALRGAATLTARLHRIHGPANFSPADDKKGGRETDVVAAMNFVARGGELTKRTRKGDLHRKQVSFNVNSNWQVVAKLKSKHMGGTFTKKKNFVVYGICRDVAVWPGGDGEKRGYFGIKTAERTIEFECEDESQKQTWVDGIQSLLDLH